MGSEEADEAGFEGDSRHLARQKLKQLKVFIPAVPAKARICCLRLGGQYAPPRLRLYLQAGRGFCFS